MAKILCIETSSTNCSVAIYNKNTLVSLKEDNNKGYSHAESLHLFINEVLESAKIKIDDLDAIAVSKGPGSYTGLRIGVSSAKGLCYASNTPLISINTLESLARQLVISEGKIIPMLDARRMEVYTNVLDSNYKIIEETQALILDEKSFQQHLTSSKSYLIGSGVSKFKPLIQHEAVEFIEDAIPSAKELGLIAYEKFLRNEFENVAYFEPFYLKDFQTTPPKKK